MNSNIYLLNKSITIVTVVEAPFFNKYFVDFTKGLRQNLLQYIGNRLKNDKS